MAPGAGPESLLQAEAQALNELTFLSLELDWRVLAELMRKSHNHFTFLFTLFVAVSTRN